MLQAPLRSEIVYEMVDVDYVVRALSRTRGAKIFILDYGGGNPFAERLGRPDVGFGARVRGDNILLVSAGGVRPAASDGDNVSRISEYARAFLKEIKAPPVEVTTFFTRVADDVSTATERQQRPVVAINLADQFYLTPRPSSPTPTPAPVEDRSVEFLFATTTQPRATFVRYSYSGERNNEMTFGAARVTVPLGHKFGQIELPTNYRLFDYTIYEEKGDSDTHFVITDVVALPENAWTNLIRESRKNEVLIFVHGYNTSFDEALYRQAKITWDLQYRGLSILFTWASRGGTLNYVYDQQSALIARQYFISLVNIVHQLGITKINVLAHSMVNLVVVDGLASGMNGAGTEPVKLDELILAASDLDWNYFEQVGPRLGKMASGITLYASSADKAMTISRRLAGGVRRAGDLCKGFPIIVAGVESIDVTALGNELFGLNHDVFASKRSLIDDIYILVHKHLHPPRERLAEILGVPAGSAMPRFWRYAR